MAAVFTEEQFETEVLKSDKVALVDFYADWCGPCKMMAPIVEQLAEEYEGQAVIGKLNIDDEPFVASRYRVLSIPTLMFFKDGKEVDRIVGATDKADVEAKLKAHM